MHSDLSRALQLQHLDKRIIGLNEEIRGLPKRIATVEHRLAAHKDELAATKGTLDGNRKERRSLESKIEGIKQKMSRLSEQMNTARTNEQFRAFQHEIQYCKDSIDDLEESILTKMEEAEVLEENVASAEASLKAESARVNADVERAKARIEADRHELEGRLEERRALADQLEPRTRRAYERLRRSHGTALAQVQGETCNDCHVRLRPKLMQDLRQLTDGILTCETCGRIVYILEDPGPEDGSSEAAS